jgi:hypothetical protein
MREDKYNHVVHILQSVRKYIKDNPWDRVCPGEDIRNIEDALVVLREAAMGRLKVVTKCQQ